MTLDQKLKQDIIDILSDTVEIPEEVYNKLFEKIEQNFTVRMNIRNRIYIEGIDTYPE